MQKKYTVKGEHYEKETNRINDPGWLWSERQT